LLWASVREVPEHFSGGRLRCDIVTVPHDNFEQGDQTCGNRLERNVARHVKMFANDAKAAGFFALIKSIPSQLRRRPSIFTEAMHASNSSRVPLMSPPS